MLADVEAVRHGAQPVTGFGYFIALPSLHAALATVCQCALRPHRSTFWFLMPVNVLLLISTFVLGQHYVVDTALGIGLGLAVWQGIEYFGRPWIHDAGAPAK